MNAVELDDDGPSEKARVNEETEGRFWNKQGIPLTGNTNSTGTWNRPGKPLAGKDLENSEGGRGTLSLREIHTARPVRVEVESRPAEASFREIVPRVGRRGSVRRRALRGAAIGPAPGIRGIFG